MPALEAGAGDTPLSRIIRIRDIGSGPETHDIMAMPAECAAVAEEFGIPAIGVLRGSFLLEAGRQDRILATLHLQAAITQTCVVSLEDFTTHIEEEAKLIFVPADDIAGLDDDPDSPDEIPFDGSAIDLGAALIEQLALALDPYPRKPDVVLPEEARNARENPFATFFREQGVAAKRGKPED